MNTDRLVTAASYLVIAFMAGFAGCESRRQISALQLELSDERAAMHELLSHRIEEAQAPAPLIYVDCPQVEIEPYDDEPFIPIPIEEILEQAKERRRKLARAKVARPSGEVAPGSAPESRSSSPPAD